MKIFKYPSTIQNFSCILPSRVTYRMFSLYCLQSHAAETETQPLNCSQSRSCCTFQKWKTLFNQITHTGYFWANWKYQSVQHKNMIKYELCGWVRVCVRVSGCDGGQVERRHSPNWCGGVVHTLQCVCGRVQWVKHTLLGRWFSLFPDSWDLTQQSFSLFTCLHKHKIWIYKLYGVLWSRYLIINDVWV